MRPSQYVFPKWRHALAYIIFVSSKAIRNEACFVYPPFALRAAKEVTPIALDLKLPKNGRRLTKPAEAALFYFMTTLVAKAVSLSVTPVFTRLLAPEEYGLYSLYVTWLGILVVPLSLGISGGSVYRALGKFATREGELIASALRLVFSVGGALFLFLLLFGARASTATGLPLHVNYMLVGEALLNCCETIVFAHHRYRYSYRHVCAVNTLYALFAPLIALFFIFFTPYRAQARIYASFIASALLIIPCLLPHLARKPRRPSSELRRYLLRLALPSLPSAVSLALIAQSDKLLIEHLQGTAALGKYSVAYSVGFILAALTSTLGVAVQPWLMRRSSHGDFGAARTLNARLVLLSSLALIAFWLILPELFRLVAPTQYADALAAAYPLALAALLQFIATLSATSVIHGERTAPLSVAAVVAFLVNLGANLLLIPRLGYVAAGFTTAAAYLVLILVEFAYLAARRECSAFGGECLRPLLLLPLGIGAYLLRESLAARAFALAAVLLAALPPLIKLSQEVFKPRRV